uniref:HTH CENPB-type domain-containing protein n=1 Tax=Globodera rostochiensis TaxID=31243 RepID=A0A914GQ56_GLORO
MDLFSIQSMLNSLYAPPLCSSSSSSPSNVSSASQNPQHLAHPSGLSAFEFYLHHQHLHRQCLPSSTSNFRNAFASPDVPCAGTEHHQFDPELLQKVVHHLGALVQHNQQPFVTTSDTQGTASSPLSALLLLLQQLRSLPNGQSAVSSDPTSILPLCSPPDFCPLLPADSANANKVTAAVSSNQRSSTFEHQQTSPATSCDFVSVSSGSSCSSSFESSLGESKTFSAGGTRNASGVATAHRLSYPREFKLLVLKSFWANGQNKYRTCKEFQITKSMLNGWLQKADRIRRSRPGSLKSGRSGRRPQFPKVEQQLFEMVQHHLSLGERASNKWIRKMARKLTATAESNGGEKEEEDGGGGRGIGEDGGGMCQFSERWLNNFKRRYGIQTAEGTVTASADEADGDEARRAEALFVGAISPPPHAPFSPQSLTDELWQDEEQWRSIAWEICATNDRLPIQAFYDRFPKVLQQTGKASDEMIRKFDQLGKL